MHLLGKIESLLLKLLALLGAIAIVMLLTHVVADVLMRNLFNSPIPATYEIVTKYYMISLAFIPLAWVERRGDMVQVEALDALLSPALLRWSDRLVALISTLSYSALAWFTLKIALQNYSTGAFVMAQNTRLPTWPGYFLLPLGFSLAALVCLLKLFKATATSDNPAENDNTKHAGDHRA